MLTKVLNKVMVVAAICSTTMAFAQQEPVFTNYLAAPNVYNPAYAGSQDALNLTFLHRTQWVGFEGAPRSYFISGHSPIQDKNIGVGFSVLQDELGPEKSTNVFADFSYSLPLTATSSLRFGLKAGGMLYSNDLASLTRTEQNDDSFGTSISGEFLPNIGFGAFWQSEKFFAGISAPKLLNSEVTVDNGGKSTRIAATDRHYFLMGGGTFEVSPDITLKPSALVRLAGSSPLSVDVNVNAIFYDRLWFGLNYRLEDAVGASIGFQINEQLRVGYSYDFPAFQMDMVNHQGSHELMVTYDFVFTKGKVASPRYF